MICDGDRIGGRITALVAAVGSLAAFAFLAMYHPAVDIDFEIEHTPHTPFALEATALLCLLGLTPCMLMHDVLGDNRPPRFVRRGDGSFMMA